MKHPLTAMPLPKWSSQKVTQWELTSWADLGSSQAKKDTFVDSMAWAGSDGHLQRLLRKIERASCLQQLTFAGTRILGFA